MGPDRGWWSWWHQKAKWAFSLVDDWLRNRLLEGKLIVIVAQRRIQLEVLFLRLFETPALILDLKLPTFVRFQGSNIVLRPWLLRIDTELVLGENRGSRRLLCQSELHHGNALNFGLYHS